MSNKLKKRLARLPAEYKEIIEFNGKGFLTEKTNRALIQLVQSKNDRKAMEILLSAHDGFIRTISNKMKQRVPYLDFDDFYQQARIGFMKAVQRYNEVEGALFTTYAFYSTYALVQKYADLNRTTTTRQTNLNRKDREVLKNYRKLEREWRKKNPGAPLSDDTVYEELGISASEIQKLSDLYYSPARSLNAPVSNNSSITHLELLEGDIGDSQNEAERAFERKYFNRLALKAKLSDREVNVIKARFGISCYSGQTLESIGKKLGVSRERVRQIESRALKKLAEAAKFIEMSIEGKTGIRGYGHEELSGQFLERPLPPEDGSFFMADLEPDV